VDFAIAFDSDLSFSDVLERLEQLGPWTWRERDSAWYGNIASARTDSLLLDLVESGANETGGHVDAGAGCRYAISVRCRHGQSVSAHEWSELEHRVRQVILPALPARSLTSTDPID
jgi:hypothetical protein